MRPILQESFSITTCATLVASGCLAFACGPSAAASEESRLLLPNPAAVFCKSEGGTYRTIEEASGMRGVCVLPDGREVDAWDYFRKHHSQDHSDDLK